MRILDKCKEVNVLVIGDLMLDYYCYGMVSRVSPEAPVPVIKIEDEECRAGGAANVAVNLSALGAKPYICGILGKDEYGDKLLNTLKTNNVEVLGVVRSSNYKTMVKKRIVGNRQQIARLDFNDDYRPIESDFAILKRNVKDNIVKCDAVIISDYNKGICTSDVCQYTISIANLENIPVIIDPKGKNWDKYINADYITPNFSEYVDMLNYNIENIDSDIESSSRGFLDKYKIRNLLLTRSEKGISLITKDSIHHFYEKAREVYDVSGAGDTVNAVFSYLLSNKFEPSESAKIANIAGTIVVSKSGTATVSLKEINDFRNNKKSTKADSKICNINSLIKLIGKWRKKGETIGFTNGCFDVFHRGHISSIYDASVFTDHLIVAINSDDSVRRLKGNTRPINSEIDRAFMVACLDCVDSVVIFEEDTPEKILSYIKPDVLVKSGDYNIDEIAGRQYTKRVEIVKYIDGYSSTNIINKIKKEYD